MSGSMSGRPVHRHTRGRLTRLTDDGFNHGSPAWLPDGSALVFTRQEGLSRIIASKQDRGAPGRSLPDARRGRSHAEPHRGLGSSAR
jgi:Tol biopolymer transport system component